MFYMSLLNPNAGSVLKTAKDGTKYGSYEDTNKMAKFREVVDPSAGNVASVINPQTIMMAAALASIEKQLGDIEETQKEILSFLENEKESEIEADIKTLSKLVSQHKYNCNNATYITNSHKLVLDIQRTAQKNMIFYQKSVGEITNEKSFVVNRILLQSKLDSLFKNFKYYRLSLYVHSMSSMMEALLNGNHGEEYLSGVKSSIEDNALQYREAFEKCSAYLESTSHASAEVNLLKGAGLASDAVGKLAKKVPLLERTATGDFLHNGAGRLRDSAKNMEEDVVKAFSALSNPKTSVFAGRLKDMIQIYNHTDRICFDGENIYLIEE